MATELSKGSLFDPVLVKDLVSKVKGHSSLAVLSAQTPIPFNGRKEFTFTMDSEIDVVAENGKKSHGGITVDPVTIVPIKVEYGARISDIRVKRINKYAPYLPHKLNLRSKKHRKYAVFRCF